MTTVSLAVKVDPGEALASRLSSTMAANRLSKQEEALAIRQARSGGIRKALLTGTGAPSPASAKSDRRGKKRGPRKRGSKYPIPQGKLYGEFPFFMSGLPGEELIYGDSDPALYGDRYYANWRGRMKTDKGFEHYGVIRSTASDDGCIGADDTYPSSAMYNLAGGKELELRRWVRRGGVHVITNEHTPLGGPDPTGNCGASYMALNAYLSALYGEEATVRFGYGDYTQGVEQYNSPNEERIRDGTQLGGDWAVYGQQVANRVMPPTLNMDRFAKNEAGGRTLYVNSGGLPYISYNRIGRGAVAIMSDSNASVYDAASRPTGSLWGLHEVLLAIGGRRSSYNGEGGSIGDRQQYELFWPEQYQ